MFFLFFEMPFISLFTQENALVLALSAFWLQALIAIFQTQVFVYLNVMHTSSGDDWITWKINALRLALFFFVGIMVWMGLVSTLKMLWWGFCASQVPPFILSAYFARRPVVRCGIFHKTLLWLRQETFFPEVGGGLSSKSAYNMLLKYRIYGCFKSLTS